MKPATKARPSVWMFQGNPDRFDLDAYLATAADRITWQVSRYADKIQVGDLVYVWRAAGKSNAVSGVVASARVDSEVFVGPDEPKAHRLWCSGDPSEQIPRVWLRVSRVAKSAEVLKAKALKDDPICRGLAILKMRTGTNYGVEADQARRFEVLWNKIGTGWSYAEAIACLQVYAETKGT